MSKLVPHNEHSKLRRKRLRNGVWYNEHKRIHNGVRYSKRGVNTVFVDRMVVSIIKMARLSEM